MSEEAKQDPKLKKLVDELSQLTVLEMSQLKKVLEETWGVEAAAESTDFQVTLAEVPADKKIAVIKVVREITGLGLKEAKDMVEGAPKVLKDSAAKAEADEISKKLAEAGAKVTLKGL